MSLAMTRLKVIVCFCSYPYRLHSVFTPTCNHSNGGVNTPYAKKHTIRYSHTTQFATFMAFFSRSAPSLLFAFETLNSIFSAAANISKFSLLVFREFRRKFPSYLLLLASTLNKRCILHQNISLFTPKHTSFLTFLLRNPTYGNLV